LRSVSHTDASLLLGDAFGNSIGIDSIVESARRLWSQIPYMHQWMANPLLEINGDRASGKVVLNALRTHAEMGPIQPTGLYLDQFERHDGRWAMIERRFELHSMTQLSNFKPVAGIESAANA
jgi:hypothetical protein